MSPTPLPLILLAGGSRQYDQMPEEAGSHHPLAGYKAASLRLQGRPLIEHVCARFAACGAFAPIYVAGPEPIYGSFDLDDVRVFHTDGNFGDNLRRATEHVVARHPGLQVAYATADVLPSPDDLSLSLADFQAASPCSFWMLECREPKQSEALGSSTWKPKYWIRGDDDAKPVPTLPGHLVIADPEATRRHLLYEIFDIAYNTRNTSIEHRVWAVAVGILSLLLRADWRRLRERRSPTTTFDIVIHGLRFAFHLRRGIDHRRMARLLGKIFLTREYRRGRPGELGRIAVLDVVSLARDVDTREEAHELGLELGTATTPD